MDGLSDALRNTVGCRVWVFFAFGVLVLPLIPGRRLYSCTNYHKYQVLFKRKWMALSDALMNTVGCRVWGYFAFGVLVLPYKKFCRRLGRRRCPSYKKFTSISCRLQLTPTQK